MSADLHLRIVCKWLNNNSIDTGKRRSFHILREKLKLQVTINRISEGDCFKRKIPDKYDVYISRLHPDGVHWGRNRSISKKCGLLFVHSVPSVDNSN